MTGFMLVRDKPIGIEDKYVADTAIGNELTCNSAATMDDDP